MLDCTNRSKCCDCGQAFAKIERTPWRSFLLFMGCMLDAIKALPVDLTSTDVLQDSETLLNQGQSGWLSVVCGGIAAVIIVANW